MMALLLIAVPLLGSAVQLLALRRIATYAVAGAAIAVELALVLLVSIDGEVMGVAMLVDGIARLMVLGLTVAVAAAIVVGMGSGEIKTAALPLLILAPATGAIVTRPDPTVSSLLWELTLLAGIVALHRDHSDDQVSIHRYLAAVVVGAMAILVALALADLYGSGHDPVEKKLTLAIAAVGWGLLLGAFPFQFWLLPVCRTASAFRATILLAVIRPLGLAVVLGTLAALPWLLSETRALGTLIVGGTAAAFICAGLSLSQRHPLARLAYLATADVAFILTGSATGSEIGFSGAVCATISHTMVMVIFPASLSLLQNGGSVSMLGKIVTDARRVGRAGIAVGTLALVGMPLSSGFVGRWLILQALWPVNPTAVVVLLLAGGLVLVSAIGLGYSTLGSGASVKPESARIPHAHSLAAIVAVSGLLVLALGIYPAPVIDTIVNTLAELGGMPSW